MTTVVSPDAAGLEVAVQAINAGEPVVLPTDTVYGLAVRAGDAVALERLFELKRRPAERSIAVLVADADQAGDFASLTDDERRVAARFWPGALTLVLNRLDSADSSIGRDDGTVGVRCPDHAFVRELAAVIGPLATTSANLSGEPTPDNAADAAHALDGFTGIAIDGGPCSGQASTVARITAQGALQVLRQGALSQQELEQAINTGA